MTRIGFIGVGTMGFPMAANLLKKGFAVTVYDINAGAVKARRQTLFRFLSSTPPNPRWPTPTCSRTTAKRV